MIEFIFAWGGLGQWGLNAIIAGDYRRGAGVRSGAVAVLHRGVHAGGPGGAGVRAAGVAAMNFDYPAELAPVRARMRAHMAGHCPPGLVRQALEGDASGGRRLWSDLAGLGLVMPQAPVLLGGCGDALLACMAAEELGRALAPVPHASVALATELLLAAGTDAQQRRYVPALASGLLVATLALVEGPGDIAPGRVRTVAEDGRLSGVKMPVLDGGAADLAIVAARAGSGLSLFIVDLHGPGVTRQAVVRRFVLVFLPLHGCS